MIKQPMRSDFDDDAAYEQTMLYYETYWQQKEDEARGN